MSDTSILVPDELRRAREREERDDDKSYVTDGLTVRSETVEKKTGYVLTELQSGRAQASTEYCRQLREFGLSDLADKVEVLGLAVVDEQIIKSTDFSSDKNLKALYVIELMNLFGECRQMLIDESSKDQDERSPAYDSLKWLFISIFDDRMGIAPNGGDFSVLDTPDLIKAAMKIRDDYNRGIKDPTVMSRHIHEEAKGAKPSVVVRLNGDVPCSVELVNLVRIPRTVGGKAVASSLE